MYGVVACVCAQKGEERGEGDKRKGNKEREGGTKEGDKYSISS